MSSFAMKCGLRLNRQRHRRPGSRWLPAEQQIGYERAQAKLSVLNAVDRRCAVWLQLQRLYQIADANEERATELLVAKHAPFLPSRVTLGEKELLNSSGPSPHIQRGKHAEATKTHSPMQTRTMRTYGLIFAAIIIGSTALSKPATAQVRYRVTILPDLAGKAGQPSVATALNDQGVVVGFSEDDSQLLSAVDWDNGQVGALLPASSSTAFGVNNRLAVVGGIFSSPDQPPSQSAFLLQQGQVIMLGDFPGGRDASSAFDINEAGQIVGIGCATEGCVAALWEHGTMQSLGDLPGGPVSSAASAINNRGEVVGSSAGTRRGLSPVLWQGGTIVALPTLPARFPGGSAADINNHGQIVGSVFEGPVINNSRAVLWQEGEIVPLPLLPGYVGSHASAINEVGSIVGGSFNPDGQERAVLWESGLMMDLHELLVEDQAAFIELTNASDINELGQIVAQGFDLRREPAAPCALLLTPVPE